MKTSVKCVKCVKNVKSSRPAYFDKLILENNFGLKLKIFRYFYFGMQIRSLLYNIVCV